MSIYQECPKCHLSTSEFGNVCELCKEEAKDNLIFKLEDQLVLAISALEFYANKYNYFDGMPGRERKIKNEHTGDTRLWDRDNGNIARTALKDIKNESN